MKILKNKTFVKISTSLIGALIVTLVIGVFGLAEKLDSVVADSWYQQPKALDGEIIVIGIDEKSLSEIGPYNTWDRTVMASALEKLSEDPENRPAVVAIDTVYNGESSPEADESLVNAAKKLGNVVTGAFATITTTAVFEDDKVYFDHFSVVSFDEPFNALKEVTTEGHVNAMYDTDGILRHAMLFVDNNEERVYSMAYETARLYGEAVGRKIIPPKTGKRGYFYVDFSATPGGYNDGYSLVDLIEGRLDPSVYAGKIVFIGPYTAGLQDAYFTPIERSKQMYGVEYQANVVQTILDGNYKTEIPKLPQILVLFVVCALSLFAFQSKGIRFSSLIAVAVTALGIGAAFLAYNVKIGGEGHVIHPLWIPIGVVILYVAAIVIHYVKTALERQRVTKTFERYVAPEIVKEILKEGTENLSLGGKTVDIAVLFVDVRGFTTMSENLPPEKVVLVLNKYLTMASGCVEENKGTLDKFVGDAMMAFWGAPLPQEDAVYNAVKTAMGIVEGARRVSEEIKSEIGVELRVGVGVNYGPAVVGNMGAEKHMDYTAIGDTVNTAARLEANAPGGKVYISRSVADKLGDRIEYVSLGSTIKLKGKAEGFEVLDLTKVR